MQFLGVLPSERGELQGSEAAQIPREPESRDPGYIPAMRAAVRGKQNNHKFFSYHI